MFEWSLPTRVVFGLGRYKSAHKHLRGFGKSVFIVTSRSFARGGPRAAVLDELLEQLKRLDVEWKVFSEIEPNPRTATVDRAAALLREQRPRYVLALGGGSVMDAAKCLALLGRNEGGIWEYAYRGPGRPMRPYNDALPLVCIPTIAATSSETDSYAVVTEWDLHRKVTVFGDALLPKLSIIDPELTFTVPPAQTVEGAFDMITHVMESYLSTREPAPIQDRITEAIVETVATSLPRVLADPKDALGRSQLSWCGALALSGVLSGRDGGWPIHALEHGLSAWTDLGHGRGLALLLPRIMAFDAVAIPEKIQRFNRRLFGADDGFVKFMKEVGAWTRLSDVLRPGDDTEAVVAKTVDHALEVNGIWKQGREPFLDNIRPLARADALAVLRACAAD